ncbi:HK97 family phage prohead protease [Eubacteriales bacterium OttesenSCG-928-A19]|nr:HK97 family phage prohead protease [Eubacteriales bacterium OttesenSCG-928-A19]
MKELRICEIRANDPAESEGLVIEGVPIVYDQPTTVHDPAGSYTEIIRSGALDGADLSDARLLYNHDQNRVPLARTPMTMQFSVDPAGLHMTATLPDTEEARTVYTAVQRGDLSGMSFAFKVPKGGDRYNPSTRTREIMKIEKVYEVSIVPFPAYPQTSVEARSAMQVLSSAERKQAIIAVNKLLIREI